MNRIAFAVSPLLLMVLGSCAPTPSWYGVPAQHKPIESAGTPVSQGQPIGEHMCAVDANADQYIVKDVKGLEGEWRWTFAEPELRFRINYDAKPRRFRLQFGINDRTFKETGPPRLVLEVNGKEVARSTYDSFGEKEWVQPVKPELLNPGVDNTVRIRVLNPWQAPDPGVKLGFVLKCAGFVAP